jgi:hypothetical protein
MLRWMLRWRVLLEAAQCSVRLHAALAHALDKQPSHLPWTSKSCTGMSLQALLLGGAVGMHSAPDCSCSWHAAGSTV